MRTVLSLLPENRVSDFLEYVKHSTVPVWPVRVCTTLLDLGSVSQILMVLSAAPVMTKSWLKIL